MYEEKELKILMEVASKSIEPLPKDFAGSEACQRMWAAFHLGRDYQNLQLVKRIPACPPGCKSPPESCPSCIYFTRRQDNSTT